MEFSCEICDHAFLVDWKNMNIEHHQFIQTQIIKTKVKKHNLKNTSDRPKLKETHKNTCYKDTRKNRTMK